MARLAILMASAALVAGCAGSASAPASGGAASPSVAAPAPVLPSPTASTPPSISAESPSVEPSSAAGPLVGVWSRIQDCAGQLAAFEAAGIAESHVEWIVGNWVGEGVEAEPSDVCADARPAEVHSHFFTADGEFGSYDATGGQVDDGDYQIAGPGTLDFESHASEFGYDGPVLVDYVVDGDEVTFEVRMPPDCTGPCLDAHAWALSAFFGPTPWMRDSRIP
jgi:hypothetical protein